jgi:hypothetical protein
MTRDPMTGNLFAAPSARLASGRRPSDWRDARLFAATIDWLDALPFGVRPVHLPVDFIRITNELMRLWDHPVELERYFLEKELSRRSGRLGFPPLVGEELRALHVYSTRRRLRTH